MLWYSQLSKHKYIEAQLKYELNEWQWFVLNIQCTRKRDHAGFQFELEFIGLLFHFWIYDHRHWDYDEDCWVDYEDIIS